MIAIVTGSLGLVGRETVRFLSKRMDLVIGIDNKERERLFGITQKDINRANYQHNDIDISSQSDIDQIFKTHGDEIGLIIHAAGQPSHDLAASIPFRDFEINTIGTLNLLEATRKYCPDAVFVYTSTNKVYGDNPNKVGLKIKGNRFVLDEHYEPIIKEGFTENLSIDNTLHSLMGTSKLSADIYVQEYGNYYNLNTVSFRCGCITGPLHAGAKLHGFLSYMGKCVKNNTTYEIIGYNGFQVRDNIHVYDLVRVFWNYFLKPKKGGNVYNMGGGTFSNCSLLEAIYKFEELSKSKLKTKFIDKPRKGDHKWYISDTTKFKKDYPKWKQIYNIDEIITEIYESV